MSGGGASEGEFGGQSSHKHKWEDLGERAKPSPPRKFWLGVGGAKPPPPPCIDEGGVALPVWSSFTPSGNTTSFDVV